MISKGDGYDILEKFNVDLCIESVHFLAVASNWEWLGYNEIKSTHLAYIPTESVHIMQCNEAFHVTEAVTNDFPNCQNTSLNEYD